LTALAIENPALSGNPQFPGGQLPSSTSPLTTIQFTPTSGPQTGSGNGIVLYNLALLQNGVPFGQELNSFNNVDFLASFTVSDTKTNTSALVTFHGKWNGTNNTSQSIAWVNDQGNLSATEAYRVLGIGTDTRTYDFKINPGDLVTTSDINGNGVGTLAVDATVTATPEPASLMLAGFGLPLVVLMRRRLKKGQSELSVA
jgi:hypothetical protein